MRTLSLSTYNKQNGVVLVVSLIMLLILTLLGISALNTTSMEEKMATNSQSINRAFQAAEAGIDAAYADSDSFNLSADITNKVSIIADSNNDGDITDAGDYSAGANTTASYLRATNPPVGSLYSSSLFSAFHFDLQSIAGSSVTDPGGTTALISADNSAIVRLHGGAYQIGPKL